MDINQVVQELHSLANTGTRVPGFRRKVMVDIDRLTALAEELRRGIPSHMQEAQEILRQKESILNLAMLESQRIRSSAEQEATSLTKAAEEEHKNRVGGSEIVKGAETKAAEIKEEALMEAQQIIQDAQRRAYRIINEAEAAAVSRRDGADQYAREVLFNLEEELAQVLGQVRKGIDTLRLEGEGQPMTNGAAHAGKVQASNSHA
jgi:vacuolar-type H+-ATPase subunit H